MAKNKAAKITSRGTYVYKNSRYNEITDSMPSRENLDQYIYIPDISNLQTGIIDRMTTTTTINGLKCYKIQEENGSISNLDFGDNDVTFMCCKRDQNGKTLGVIDPALTSISSSMWTENGIPAFYRDGYGAGYPSLKYLQWSGPVRHAFQMFIPQWVIPPSLMSYYEFTMTREQSVNRINGNNINFLNTKYDGENDCILIPASYGGINCQDLNGVTHSFDYDDIEFGYNLYKDGIGSFGIENSSYPNFIRDDNTNQFIILNPASGVQALYYDVKANFPNTEIGYTGTIKTNGKIYRLQCSFVDKNLVTLSNAFAYDSKNDAVYLIYTGFNYLNGYIYTYLIPFGAMTTSKSAPSEFNLNDFMKSLLGALIDSDNIPVPAPDAYGPGNPYQDTNNAGSSIGGNFDFNDVIETNDATPNTGFDTFDYQTSLFGTYVMSNKNIKDYTHTLNLLYEHSSDILFGSAASAMAGRIVEGTTGLLSLPITIPSTNYTNTTFSIGNTGIADENATYAELSKGNFTTANYLTKNMIEYTINMDPIKHRYDNFLDFPPYSSASIYIPYIGTQELPLGIIQSTSQYTNVLQLKVRVDVPTGDFVVILFSNGVPITHWNGNCARTIQLAVNDNSQIIRTVSNQISKAAGSMIMGATTGGVLGAASQVVQNVVEEGIQSQTPISTTQHKIGNIQNSGVSGWMDNQQFYIIVERPVMYLPYNYGHHIGYPTDKVVRIGSCKGFCQFGEVHIECSANQAEKDEIIRVLQKGVILNVS